VSPRYRLTPSAQQDVDRITDFIAEDNVEAALRVHDALEEAFRHLAEIPAMGHTRED
jgi:plasmid stabilization system protein ParE